MRRYWVDQEGELRDVATDERNDEDEDNRWEAFSDFEIRELRAALGEYDDERYTEPGELQVEVTAELERRERERKAPTYRGPGTYTNAINGTILTVAGAARIDHVPCVLIGRSMFDPQLWSMRADVLEQRAADGSRVWQFEGVVE